MDIEERFERLEKQNRHMRVTGGAALIVLAAAALMGYASPEPKVLEVEKLIIKNESGMLSVQMDKEGLLFFDKSGKTQAELDGDSIKFADENGTHRTSLGNEGLVFWDENVHLQMYLHSERLTFLDDEGTPRIGLTEGGLELSDERVGIQDNKRVKTLETESYELILLKRRLSSKDNSERFEAVNNVYDKRIKKALPYLLPLLEDSDQFVQVASIQTVGEFMYIPALPVLVRVLRDTDITVRDEALLQLVRITGETNLMFDVRASSSNREKAIKKWEEWLERNNTSSSVSTKLPEINTTVVEVDNDIGFVILGVGKNDGVLKGAVFNIYHGTDYLGVVEIDEIYEKYSAARIKYSVEGCKIRINDRAISITSPRK